MSPTALLRTHRKRWHGTPEAPLDEPALIRQARHDRQAFAPLYERYVGPIYRFCSHRLGSREAAEDATSQTFVKALAALPSYRGGPVAGWLFAIARNVVIDSQRSRQIRERVHALDGTGDLIDATPSPEQAAMAGSDAATLSMLLSSLPNEQRQVIELRLAGLRSDEIAAALGRSVPAIKTLQYRAMRQLRAQAQRGRESLNERT